MNSQKLILDKKQKLISEEAARSMRQRSYDFALLELGLFNSPEFHMLQQEIRVERNQRYLNARNHAIAASRVGGPRGMGWGSLGPGRGSLLW